MRTILECGPLGPLIVTTERNEVMTSRFSILGVLLCAAAWVAAASPAAAQGANPLSASAKAQFTGISAFVTRSADKYFMMCSAAAGSKPPQQSFEQSATTKAALVKALADGVAFCQSAMGGMTDQKGAETIDFVFGPTPRLGVLFFVTTHTYEHYGNLVTYMRLNKIVPPSSEAPPAAPGR
jgi:hypothetical protein